MTFQAAAGEDSKKNLSAPKGPFCCYPHPGLALQLGYSQPSAFQAAAGEASKKKKHLAAERSSFFAVLTCSCQKGQGLGL